MGDDSTKVMRHNIDPYPLATEVKLLWDSQERIGVIVTPEQGRDKFYGELVSLSVKSNGEYGAYEAPVVVTPYGETLQGVFWDGEKRLGFWSPEFLLPKDFPFSKRPTITVTRNLMYVISYTSNDLVNKEGFMYISGESEQSLPF